MACLEFKGWIFIDMNVLYQVVSINVASFEGLLYQLAKTFELQTNKKEISH